ncbi:2OG-Fe(II) oxygenase [uncultured Paraglaciecola sp.]|uniref:2OG-Fe(II) oxygenase n=1 Tax=uncultured Paraglaciecola sp. TaxID=1765024 RepID=UPI002592C9ED|nr:2OG-Fe(II) oxygenase [uncultured Paraglaciecola sp.]
MSNLNNIFLTDQVLDLIADSIASQGYVLLDNFLPIDLASSLLTDVEVLSRTEFKAAGIGRNKDNKLNSKIRTDSTLWLTQQTAPQMTYISVMEQLKQGVNERLFMGLSEFECHYSRYQKGDFYLRHLDAFKSQQSSTQKNRRLSSVFYLTPDWQTGDGGELCLYADQKQVNSLLKLAPLFNQCVLFLSDVFPHEVLESQIDRFSIAGWYR